MSETLQPHGPYSAKKALAKVGTYVPAITIINTLSNWLADLTLAWIKYYNDHSERFVIRMPTEWATSAGLALVIAAAIITLQDYLRFKGKWPEILS